MLKLTLHQPPTTAAKWQNGLLTVAGVVLLSRGTVWGLVLALVALSGALTAVTRPPAWWRRVDHLIQLLAQPAALALAWGTVAGLLVELTGQEGVLYLAGLLALPLWLPWARCQAGPLCSPGARLLALLWLFQLPLAPSTYWGLDGLSLGPSLTYLVGALGFFGAGLALLEQWGFGRPFNLARRKDGWQFLPSIILLVLAFFLVRSNWPNNWSRLTVPLVMTALEAGIGEEFLCRAALPAFLVRWLSRGRLVGTIVLSSLAFGLLHLINLAGGQGGAFTAYQVAMAGVGGLLYAIFYLYTGQLWLPMVLHAFTDLTGALAPASNSAVGRADWGNLAVLLALALGLLAYFATGKRGRLMEAHLMRLSGE